MLGQDSLQRAAEAAGIDAPVFWRDETGSTNTDAVAMAERGVPEFAVFATGHQVAGRGRLGRTWVAPPGSSLLVSVVLRPGVSAEDLPLISLAAALELAGACRSVLGLPARLKWPNDVLVRERKLAGILPEAKLAGGRALWVVVGVGVNLRQTAAELPEEARETATSVALEGGEVDEEREVRLLASYLSGLRRYRPGEVGWDEAVLTAARDACDTIGRQVTATTVEGRTVEGYAADLDGRGGLVIVSGGRRETVAFGEVRHLR